MVLFDKPFFHQAGCFWKGGRLTSHNKQRPAGPFFFHLSQLLRFTLRLPNWPYDAGQILGFPGFLTPKKTRFSFNSNAEKHIHFLKKNMYNTASSPKSLIPGAPNTLREGVYFLHSKTTLPKGNLEHKLVSENQPIYLGNVWKYILKTWFFFGHFGYIAFPYWMNYYFWCDCSAEGWQKNCLDFRVPQGPPRVLTVLTVWPHCFL